MENFDFDEWVDTWIDYHNYDSKSKEAEDHFWAIKTAFNFGYDNPEMLWRLILEVLKRNPPPLAEGMLAVGPLEDILTKYGPLFIDRVEKEAAVNPKFKDLLSEVWEDDNDDEIWRRVQKALQ